MKPLFVNVPGVKKYSAFITLRNARGFDVITKSSAIFLCLLGVSSVQAQWIQTSGPAGGAVTALAVIGNRILAGTYGGIFISDDGGASWRNSSQGLNNQYVRSLSVTPSMIFAGTDASICVSTDRGDSWSVLTESVYIAWVSSVVVKDTFIFASSNFGYGLYRSGDGGKTWASINSGLPDSRSECMVAIDSILLAGITAYGVYRSTDNGNSWIASNTGMTNFGASSFLVQDSLVYCGTGNGVFRSSNRGLSWSKIWPENLYATIHSLKAVGQKLYAAADYGLYSTTDGGNSWASVYIDPNGWSILAVDALGSSLFLGIPRHGILLSSNGGITWQPANRGFTATNVNSITAHDGYLFAAADNGIFRSTNHGDTWIAKNNGLSTPNARALYSSGSQLFAGTERDGIFVSTNDGDSWTLVGDPYKGPEIVYQIAGQGGTIVAAAAGGVFRLQEGQWVSSNTGIAQWGVAALSLLCADGRLFVGCQQKGIYASDDTGKSWTRVFFDDVSVYSLAAHGSSLFASFEIRSTDHGSTWNYDEQMPWSIYCLNSAHSHLYATGALGVSMSDDSASHWKPVNLGLGEQNVWGLGSDAEYLYVAPLNSGVWRRPLYELEAITVDRARPVPQTYLLYQNYPNPFNPTTTIRYGLTQRSQVTLTVYTVLGQKVTELVNGEIEAGYHEVEFDAAELASGVYFYRLHAGNFTQTRKLMLVK